MELEHAPLPGEHKADCAIVGENGRTAPNTYAQLDGACASNVKKIVRMPGCRIFSPVDDDEYPKLIEPKDDFTRGGALDLDVLMVNEKFDLVDFLRLRQWCRK